MTAKKPLKRRYYMPRKRVECKRLPIPITAAQRVGLAYGYDQVVIIARRTGDDTESGEHVTTWGVNAEHCNVAAKIGNFIKYNLMKWPKSAEKT